MSKNTKPNEAEEMEKMRMTVVGQELSARSYRATRQKMEDTIAIFEIQEKYDQVMAENQKRLAAAQEAYQKAMAEFAANNPQITTQESAPVVNMNEGL